MNKADTVSCQLVKVTQDQQGTVVVWTDVQHHQTDVQQPPSIPGEPHIQLLALTFSLYGHRAAS